VFAKPKFRFGQRVICRADLANDIEEVAGTVVGIKYDYREGAWCYDFWVYDVWVGGPAAEGYEPICDIPEDWFKAARPKRGKKGPRA
jgi:hypothetical protein